LRALAERLEEYDELCRYQKLLNDLFPRYVPNTNMEMFSKDISEIANFHRKFFGNWDSIVSDKILTHPALNFVKNILEFMEHISSNQEYIIFTGIWKLKLSGAMNGFEANLGKKLRYFLLQDKKVLVKVPVRGKVLLP